MPLTNIQRAVLKTIAENRSPDNYLAGATLLHRQESSPRYSRDLDYFHDVATSVAQSAETDGHTLEDSGYQVEWLLRTPHFYRALVSSSSTSIRLDWAQDSAFRFFPVLKDKECGYRLHDADAATNKILALAGREEVRDFVDILYLDESYLSLGALAWAACGKDPGFTPEFLLEQIARHTAYSDEDFKRLDLVTPVSAKEMKQRWLPALENAKTLIKKLPTEELGVLYLNTDSPTTPDPSSPKFKTLIRHTGSVTGAWPTPADLA